VGGALSHRGPGGGRSLGQYLLGLLQPALAADLMLLQDIPGNGVCELADRKGWNSMQDPPKDRKQQLQNAVAVLLAKVPLPPDLREPDSQWVPSDGRKTDPRSLYGSSEADRGEGK